MNEEFMHYLWAHRLFNKELLTQDGEEVSVLHPGTRNNDGGPDILTARIRIGKTLWAGNVEFHVHSSDWYRHNHQNDLSYDNIILHVVMFDEGKEIRRRSGELIPFIVVQNCFDYKYFHNYEKYQQSKYLVACRSQLESLDSIVWLAWKERLLVERLERKTEEIHKYLTLFNNDWDTCFYVLLAGNFGMRVNKEAFDLLAKSLPLKILLKHRNSLLQLEALLFGQAGLLPKNVPDPYVVVLLREYKFLQKKYNLTPLCPSVWKKLRLRPPNFPTLKIAQFAVLIYNYGNMFHHIRNMKDYNSVSDMFNLCVSDYWQTHYSFGRKSSAKDKKLGRAGINLILINTVIPFLFYYGKRRKLTEYTEKAFELYCQVAPEDNAITKKFKKYGIKLESAMDSQALIELHNSYCINRKCLHCAIGHYLLGRNN
jgi:hypothetical protein